MVWPEPATVPDTAAELQCSSVSSPRRSAAASKLHAPVMTRCQQQQHGAASSQCHALCAGHMVYLGQREGILPFFAGLGFAPPPRKGAADFLQEVTSLSDQVLPCLGCLTSFYKRLCMCGPDAGAADRLYVIKHGRCLLCCPDMSSGEGTQLHISHFF